MKQKFINFIEHTLWFLKKHSEVLTIPMAFVLWWLSEPILRYLDPYAATYDSGIFQNILFTIIQFLVYHGVAWLVFKLTFPVTSSYLDEVFDYNMQYQKVNPLSKWEKSKLALYVFVLYFIGIILLAKSL